MINLNKLMAHNRELSIRLLRASPVGGSKGLVRLSLLAEDDVPLITVKDGGTHANRLVDAALLQLDAYFSKKLKAFSLQLDLRDISDFQQKVLQETVRIPFGEVITYGEIALCIGKPDAARAVGGALARNPIAIVIPCHRVVGFNGYLRGFSSPHGLATKEKLLSHEGIRVENGRVKNSFL